MKSFFTKSVFVAILIGATLFSGCMKSNRREHKVLSNNINVKYISHEYNTQKKTVINFDSISPTHTYTFCYTDSDFPSANKEYKAIICGFDTDGKGRFYIAGGNPIRLVCYYGTKKEYDILLSDAISNLAIMNLL